MVYLRTTEFKNHTCSKRPRRGDQYQRLGHPIRAGAEIRPNSQILAKEHWPTQISTWSASLSVPGMAFAFAWHVATTIGTSVLVNQHLKEPYMVWVFDLQAGWNFSYTPVYSVLPGTMECVGPNAHYPTRAVLGHTRAASLHASVRFFPCMWWCYGHSFYERVSLIEPATTM